MGAGAGAAGAVEGAGAGAGGGACATGSVGGVVPPVVERFPARLVEKKVCTDIGDAETPAAMKETN